mmetsp:Transcript_18124/g.51117  ORF Transcript_18124/g.51117 Transcript_18124/m.51117 type:complete len:397 (+) Transcript_18124:254-1444(+)
MWPFGGKKKLIPVIGPTESGKSMLLYRMDSHMYEPLKDHVATAVNDKTHHLTKKVGGTKFHMQWRDCKGDTLMVDLQKTHNVDPSSTLLGVIIMFDIYEFIQDVEQRNKWLKDIERLVAGASLMGMSDIFICVLLNKMDLFLNPGPASSRMVGTIAQAEDAQQHICELDGFANIGNAFLTSLHQDFYDEDWNQFYEAVGFSASRAAKASRYKIDNNLTHRDIGKQVVTSNGCFHIDTVVATDGLPSTPLRSLLDSGAANARGKVVIVHTALCDGVRLHAANGASVGLTRRHLVFVRRAGRRHVVPAGGVRAGDELYTDLAESGLVVVARVTAEHDQAYVGVYCPSGTFLANGIKCSAFSQYHSLPATAVRVFSPLLGLEAIANYSRQLARTVQYLP